MSEAREEELLNEISERDRELKRLRAGINGASGPQKRKRDAADSASSKRRKTGVLNEEEIFDWGGEWALLEQGIDEVREAGGIEMSHGMVTAILLRYIPNAYGTLTESRTLLKKLYELLKLRGDGSQGAHQMARHLASVITAAETFASASASSCRANITIHSQMGNTERAHQKSCGIILRVIGISSHDFEDLAFKVDTLPSAKDAPIGAVIYAILSFFKTLLRHLALYSNLIAQPREDAKSAGLSVLRPSTQPAGPEQTSFTKASAESLKAVSAVLAAFFNHFIKDPSPPAFNRNLRASVRSAPGTKSYSKLLEGAQFLLLNRAGTLLDQLVFSRSEGAGSIRRAREQGRGHDERANAAEARYVLQLLKKACSTNIGAPGSFQAEMADATKARFLSTLMTACFGGEDIGLVADRQASPLLEISDGALEPDEVMAETDVEGRGVKWRFLEELWDMFGWDVMIH